MTVNQTVYGSDGVSAAIRISRGVWLMVHIVVWYLWLTLYPLIL